MRKIVAISLIFVTALVMSGCAGNIESAVRAYGITAEEQANLMDETFDRCLTEANPVTKKALCNSVKSSIDAYRRSASQLKMVGMSE